MSSSSPDALKLSSALRYAVLCCVVLLIFAGISWLFVVTKPTPPTQEELNARERLQIRAEVEESAVSLLAGEEGSALSIARSMEFTAEHLLQEKLEVFIPAEDPAPPAPAAEESSEESAEDAPEASSEDTAAQEQETAQSNSSSLPAVANASVANAAVANSASRLSVNRSLGHQVYEKHCARCHLDDGQGRVDAHWPPLQDSEWLLQPVDVLARIVLHGLSGPIEVKGVSYGEAIMLPLGYLLEDAEIAAVLNYVRENFAPQSDLPVIEVAQVAQVRADTLSRDPSQTWTYAELKPFFLETAN